MANENQYCTFYLDGSFFGVEVGRVQEILRHQEMTPVPLAEGHIEGLINLRGQIMTAVDLRTRVALPPRGADAQPINVVIRRGEDPVSLLVDEIGDVIRPGHELFEEAPDNTDPRFRELLRGVYKLEDRLLLVLDVDRVLQMQPIGRD